MYRVLIQEIDENGGTKVLHDEKHKNIMMLAESAENNMVTEAMLNVSTVRAASTIAQSSSFFTAAKLAVIGDIVRKAQKEDEEKGEVQ